MRKVLFFILAVMVTACTVTEQDRAENLIRQYLDRNANDPSSVDIIEVGQLRDDSVWYFHQTEESKVLDDSLKYYESEVEYLSSEGRYKESSAMAERALSLIDRIKAKTDSFKPYLRGKCLRMEYRAKNAVGALVKKTVDVRFDEGVTEITSFEDL
jgi:hypothetical protein